MRVIAGGLKGRRLKAPTWDGLRPTSDRLRETLFNILGGEVVGARVLDGYAGTGAIGIEALSRGAAWVVFVERDRRAADLVEENLRHCGVSEGYAIIRADLDRATGPFGPQPFDLILLDPPYAVTDMERAIAHAGEWLSREGLLVYEHARRTTSPTRAGALARVRTVMSGDSALSFYRSAVTAPSVEPEDSRAEHDTRDDGRS
jgi:16S rRNA (guanine966-N2)-methyltransferase